MHIHDFEKEEDRKVAVRVKEDEWDTKRYEL